MIPEIYNLIVEFLKLTFTAGVFWEVLPLVIATIVTISYFEKYREEKIGWDSYVANSLILVFVSVALLKYIYGIGGRGAGNYIDLPGKTIAVVFLLLIGLLIVKFNFTHLLPEKITKYISSPLTVNILAYVIILYVHSAAANSVIVFISLLIIFVLLIAIFDLIKFPLDMLFDYFTKLKRKEKVENIKEEKYRIKELRGELKFEEKKMKKVMVKGLDKQKREAVSLKKLILRK